MSKIKIIFFIILAFIIYKGVVAFKNFEIGVSDRVAEIEELADFEKEGEVIGLMMYLGDPLELKEHLFTESRSKCLKLKEIAEESSSAFNRKLGDTRITFMTVPIASLSFLPLSFCV